MLYTEPEEYAESVLSFLEAGLAVGEAALVFAPQPNVDLLRHRYNGPPGQVAFLDAVDVARNPARILPAARRFSETHAGRPIRLVGEPGWPGRSTAEMREVMRHEALFNVLFADIAATVLCPYDVAGLDASVVTAARQAHPHVMEGGTCSPSASYVDCAVMLALSDQLPPAPGDAWTLGFHHEDLAVLRQLSRVCAARFGVRSDRLADLVLAVNEAASNTLAHTEGSGTLRIWQDGDAVVCEVTDAGHMITADLAGRLQPPTEAKRGRGLWMINQLCDLVELRSNEAGTIVRMHVGIC